MRERITAILSKAITRETHKGSAGRIVQQLTEEIIEATDKGFWGAGLTFEEEAAIRAGVRRWAVRAYQLDWFHERCWWLRLSYWWKHRQGYYPEWYDADEIAASINAYIAEALKR